MITLAIYNGYVLYIYSWKGKSSFLNNDTFSPSSPDSCSLSLSPSQPEWHISLSLLPSVFVIAWHSGNRWEDLAENHAASKFCKFKNNWLWRLAYKGVCMWGANCSLFMWLEARSNYYKDGRIFRKLNICALSPFRCHFHNRYKPEWPAFGSSAILIVPFRYTSLYMYIITNVWFYNYKPMWLCRNIHHHKKKRYMQESSVKLYSVTKNHFWTI